MEDNLLASVVNTDILKTGSYALVNIGMWIYFCFRKLIDRMIRYPFVQCPNRPESHFQSCEKTNDSFPDSQLSLLIVFQPVLVIRSFYEKLSIKPTPLAFSYFWQFFYTYIFFFHNSNVQSPFERRGLFIFTQAPIPAEIELQILK